MKKYYTVRDLHNYEILVHALKSTSKMIGISDLSEKAKALEMAAKNNEENFILENHEQMIRDYGRITANIKDMLLSDDEDEDGRGGSRRSACHETGSQCRRHEDCCQFLLHNAFPF